MCVPYEVSLMVMSPPHTCFAFVVYKALHFLLLFEATSNFGREQGEVFLPPLCRVLRNPLGVTRASTNPPRPASQASSAPHTVLSPNCSAHFVPMRVNWEHRSSVKYHSS